MKPIDIIRAALPATVAYLREHDGTSISVDGRRTDVGIGGMGIAMRTLARLG